MTKCLVSYYLEVHSILGVSATTKWLAQLPSVMGSVCSFVCLFVSPQLDGVQLLCLIDKGLDGCRYLQTYGEWRTAAWLARATLSEKDCGEVFTKWADHLASVTVNNKVSVGRTNHTVMTETHCPAI